MYATTGLSNYLPPDCMDYSNHSILIFSYMLGFSCAWFAVIKEDGTEKSMQSNPCNSGCIRDGLVG